MPKEKKSASCAISSARSAARGSSIMVPMEVARSIPVSLQTASRTAVTSGMISRSSRTELTRGIMISTRGSRPSERSCAAASRIARVCIPYSPGMVSARRTPRSPSMGFCSCRRRTAASTFSSCASRSTPWASWRASFTDSSVRSGRNSCSGGSSRRTVTERPSIARRMPTKSSRCIGSRESST